MDSTIIAASLNDKELKASIDALVTYVNQGTEQISTKFNSTVSNIKNQLSNLTKNEGDITDGKAISALGVGYDRLAASMQKAVEQSAKRFDTTPLQEYRMRLHEIEAEIKKAESIQQANPQYQQALNETKAQFQQIAKIRAELESKSTLNPSDAKNLKYIVSEYERLRIQMEQLSKQMSGDWAVDKDQTQRLSQLRKEYAEIQEKIRSIGQSMIDADWHEMEMARNAEKAAQKIKEEEEAAKALVEQERLAKEEAAQKAKENAEAAKAAKQAFAELKKEQTLRVDKALGMSEKDDDAITKKIQKIHALQSELGDKGILSQPKVNQMNRAVERLEEKLEKIRKKQQQLSNAPTTTIPTKQDVFGMSEKTLDDIAKKMQAIRQYQGGLDVTTQRSEISYLNKEYARLSKTQSELMGRNVQHVQSNNALARSFGYIRNRVVYALTLGAASAFMKNLYEIRGQYELLERSLGVLVNSFEKGSQIFQELNEMAIKSPFTLVELGTAAKQLTAYNFAADEVVDTTRRLADISAALGVPMERLTYNLGQIKAQGVLNARDARDFANAGLAIVPMLAQMYTEQKAFGDELVTTAQVYDMMSKKMVTYSDVLKVLQKVTDEGGKFFDFQAKQAQTLRVQMANLTLAWNNMLNEVGKSNQGFLQLPLRGLKALLENWQTLDRVLTSIAITIGSAKAAQLLFNLSLSKANIETLRNIALTQNATAADYENALAKMNLTKAQAQWLISTNRNNVTLRAAIVNMRVLTAAEAAAAATTNILRSRWVALGATTKIVAAGIRLAAVSIKTALSSLLLNPAMWIFVATTAITDLVLQAKAAREAMHELNQEISDNAKEASQSMLDYLDNQGNQSTRRLAQQNKLTVEEGAKAWESVSEQIKQSALSSNMLMTQLLAIPDINERVAKSFEYAEKIQQAQAALQDLRDDTIKMSTDSGWWGMFGEGLTSDLKDYADYIEKYTEIAKGYGLRGENAAHFIFNMDAVKEAREEFEEELDITAESINNFIAAHNITDPIQINEILERVRAQIKTKNPQIRGELARIFDISLDKRMAELTNGAVDQNVTLWKMFMERLKEQPGARDVFKDINDEWIQSNEKLKPIQQKYIDDTLEYFKQSVPYAYEALAKMVDDANQNLRINIGITFGKEALTNLQKEVKRRIAGAAGVLDFGSDALLPTQNDNFPQWVNRRQQSIKDLHEENKLYAKDSSQWAQDQIKANNRVIQQNENVLDLFNQSHSADKKTTARHRKDVDLVAESLKQEISLINEMRSNYDKLRKAGMSNMDAITLASEGYENTIKRINKVLQKFGISEFKASDFAGTNVKQLLDSLTKQRDALIASGKVKTSSLKDLDVIIKKLTIDAQTYDLKKITDGLNSELGKLKEEYELAVGLDANPELGDMFADVFKIDTSTLPKTFAEAIDKANKIAIEKLKENKVNMPDFDFLSTNITPDKDGKWKGMSISSDLVQALIKVQKELRDIYKKNTQDIEKELDGLVKKYGTYADKVYEIEQQRLKRIKKLNEEYSEDRRNKPEYQAKRAVIDKDAARETDKAAWEDFKESDLFIRVFQNLDRQSTQTLTMMRDRLATLKAELKNLSPEQLKAIAEQMEKIDDKLVERNPFKNMGKTIKEYINALKNRKKVDKEVQTNSQKYNDENKKLVELEKQLAKARQGGDKNAVQSLEEQVRLQRTKTDAAKEEMDSSLAAQLGISDAMAQMGNLAKFAAQEFANFANAVVEIRDTLADVGVEFSDDINFAIEGLSQASEGTSEMVNSLLSLNPFGVISGFVKQQIGYGKMIAGLFGKGKKDYISKIKETMEDLIKVLDKVASYQLEAMGKMTGSRAVAEYQKLIDNNNRVIESYQQMAHAASRSGSSMGSSSYGKRTDKALRGQWEKISEVVGQSVRGTYELINLSAEQLKTLMIEMPDVWQKIDPMIREYLDQMVEYGDKATEYAEAFAEALTNISLDDLTNDFEGLLQDMDNGTKEFAENFEEYMRNAIIRSLMVGTYTSQLEAWYKNFQERIKDDDLSRGDIEALREEYMEIVSRAIEERDNLFKAMGLDSSERDLSALQQGIAGVSEETASALESYMNQTLQQVYYHSTLLEEIRNKVAAFDLDVQLGTLSQMLLQMQQSYQVQQNIASILNGVLNPSGRAIVVELN